VDNIKIDLREIGWSGLDWSGSGDGPVEGSCEHGNELSGSIRCWEFLEWLQNGQLLKKGSAPWVSESSTYWGLLRRATVESSHPFRDLSQTSFSFWLIFRNPVWNHPRVQPLNMLNLII
jgi:hypothetical protein